MVMEKYDNLRSVGRGAYGMVSLCRRRSDRKLVIIKQIPVEQMTKEERQAALNEGKVLGMLHHPNIIEYYENFLQDKALMIAMEYAPGGTLYEFLHARSDNLLEEKEILHLFAQMLLALNHVHSCQILHRDLKTHNILLNKDRNVVKIGDFGISKILSSKSKAYTVVGTPCYISPELCEGKPYNQKSDIWALGCILYELITLKLAFEASTLPALILKIMRGTFSPIADHYSEELKQLLSSMLHLDPMKRPLTQQLLAQTVLMNTVMSLYTDIGRIPYISRKHEMVLPDLMLDDVKSTRRKPISNHGSGPLKSLTTVIFCWGGNFVVPTPLALPSVDDDVVQVTVGRTQRVALTATGRVITWEAAPDSKTNRTSLQSHVLIPRFLEGQSALAITQVACGDLFTACLTDRGILLTYGSGVNGCLGHGDYDDVQQPKIVEALLGYEITKIACGSAHMLVITNDHEVFGWGKADNGRLGVGNELMMCCLPEMIPLPQNCIPSSVVCGVDCSIIVTTSHQILACGNNRFNKLGLDKFNQKVLEIVEESPFMRCTGDVPWCDENVKAVDLGFSHMAVLTEKGQLFTAGDNRFGQLGRTQLENERVIGCVDFKDLKDNCVKYVACGDTFTVAVTVGDQIFSWGKAARGRLGFEGQHFVSLPTHLPPLSTTAVTVLSIVSNSGNTIVLGSIKDQ